ncbi:MAG: NUDIX hydrolase [Sutterella sp.]|nr:NUDIX hydrolase [Sutterella sp.]
MSQCPYALLESPVPAAERDDDPLTETSLAERTLLDGKFIRVIEEDVRLPDGRPSKRFSLRHGGAAGMVALDAEGAVLLERQWRHPCRRAFWEIPAGKLDPNENELDCARRELIEECGVEASRWARLGMLNNAIGYSNERIVVYLAEDLRWGEQKLDEGEHLEVYRVKLEEALNMCADGRITDVKTIVGLFWLDRLLKKRASEKA